MTHSRSCGVSLAACEAQTCRCDKSHVGAPGGREKPAQRFDLSGACAHCGWSAVDCDRHLFGCCAACAATGGCTHDNPLHTAHNTSREDC